MIDPRAIVDPSARLAGDVRVGPFTIIGADVEIGAGTTIGPNVMISGPCTIGEGNRIHPFASLGDAPQDLKYAGEPTRLEIGDRNVIREYVTINRGTPADRALTTVGSDNLLMAYCHIAHDCVVGDHTVFANGASLGGHVQIGDYAILGGFAMIHQFCQVGAHSFCAMGSAIAKDVLPFVLVSGHPAHPHGINARGLARRPGFDRERIQRIRRHYKLVFRSGLKLEEAVERLDAERDDDAAVLAAFIRDSRRSILR
ncbi:MAG: acyl-ACP--UDP-N-acetylglucosamine O-acyltransferase [Gammaproteobacteria bacterium]|nr:acyl-ACP--UDP-N-acetylglucosamine O-acyltransferase [Gammaproteobacteria bacterium]